MTAMWNIQSVVLGLLACKDGDPAETDSPPLSQDDTGEQIEDVDEDGWLSAEDCDDEDPNINPDASELCQSGVDEDCDGLVDCEDADCVTQCIEDCLAPGDEDQDGYEDCQDEDCWGLGDCGSPEVQVTGGTLYVRRAQYLYSSGGVHSFHYANFYPSGRVEHGSESCDWTGRLFASASWNSALELQSMVRVSSELSSACTIPLGSNWLPPLSQMTWQSSSVLQSAKPWVVLGTPYGTSRYTWSFSDPYNPGWGQNTSFSRPILSGEPYALK
ncbi:MAG: hypothetical protein ACI9VR_003189 [Cognaticolwellia sp.]|jgi:hypothetical protein